MSAGNGMQYVDRTGDFRGCIFRYLASAGKQGSMNLAVEIEISDYWDPEGKEWVDWREYKMKVDGLVNLVKNSKEINENGVRSLINCCGWDGKLMSIYEQKWNPQPMSFTVEEDDREGFAGQLRLGWINPYNATPGQFGGIDEATAKAFDSQYGPQLRALAGNSVRNAAPPAGKPVPPKASGPAAPPRPSIPKRPVSRGAAARAQAAQEEQGEVGEDQPDGIPF